MRQSELDRSIVQFREKVVTSSNELVVDEDHRDGFPVMLGAEVLSLLTSFECFGINVLEWNVVLPEVVGNFSAEWTVVVSQYNNLSHQILVR